MSLPAPVPAVSPSFSPAHAVAGPTATPEAVSDVGTAKPLGANDNRRALKQGVVLVGCCTQCKQGIFSDQEYTRVRRPTIGLNHDWCVPAGAVMGS